jgi:hypothetical protein
MKKQFLLAAIAVTIMAASLWGSSITVTAPTAGASWCIGSTYTITWTKSGDMQATVAIRLRTAGSSEADPAAATICNGDPNDGSYSWTIPGTVAPGSYFIRVRTDDSTVIGDSGVFTISSCGGAASITVTSPTAASHWCKGSAYTITWSKSGTMQATAAIRLRAAGSSESDPAILAIADGTANDGSFSWTVPGTVAAGNYFIRVRTDDSTVIGDSANFEIQECAATPSITVTQPSGGSWCRGRKHTITWEKSGTMASKVRIALVNAIFLPGHGGLTKTTEVLVIADPTANDGSYEWTIPNTVEKGDYKIVVATTGTHPVIGYSHAFKITICFIQPPFDFKVREPWFRFPDPDPCFCPEFDIRELLEDLINKLGPDFNGSIFLLKNSEKLHELGAFGPGKTLPGKIKVKMVAENFGALKNGTARFTLAIFDGEGQLMKEVGLKQGPEAGLL